LLQQEAQPAAGQKNSSWMLLRVCVCVCVSLSLSMCKCLEFSLLFPHFFTGLLIITTANGTTIIIKGNRNIDTKLGKDGTEGIFFFIKQMGARATVFVLQKTTKTKCNAIHEETQNKTKKKFFMVFLFLWIVL
jgi:hypothetical protein